METKSCEVHPLFLLSCSMEEQWVLQNISLAEGGWSFLQPLPSYLPWFPEILGARVSGCPDSAPRPYCVGAWSFLQFSPLPDSEQPRE